LKISFGLSCSLCPLHTSATISSQTNELRRMLPGRWKKIIKQGISGEVHYFEHEFGRVAGVKYIP
jgi:hypothetical protein